MMCIDAIRPNKSYTIESSYTLTKMPRFSKTGCVTSGGCRDGRGGRGGCVDGRVLWGGVDWTTMKDGIRKKNLSNTYMNT